MTKAELRAELLQRRRDLDPGVRAEAAEAIALHLLATPVMSSPGRVACYLSMATEPGTDPLLTALAERGTEVIVPWSLPDGTLDWVVHDPSAPVTVTALGIREPQGVRLGSSALNDCALVIVPALAVDHAGHRLGRGAGYYDRALVGCTRPTCAIVYTHELIASLPDEPHDIPVSMAATPDGIFRVHQT